MKRFVSLSVFVIVAVLGLSLAGQIWMTRDDADRTRFQAAADDAAARIGARVQAHLSLLRGAHALFTALDGRVSRSVFRRFVANLELMEAYAGVQGIGFAMAIPTGREELAERRLLQNYGESTSIWPATEQAWRTPIVLIEPLDERNRAAIGFDMFAEATRRTAMIEAARSGRARATNRVHLVQEIDESRQAGFLVYMPLFADGPSRQPSPEAASELAGSSSLETVRGFVYAPFRAGDLFSAALGQTPLLPIHVAAYEAFVAPENLLFRSGDPADSGREDFAVERRLNVAGREWILRMTPTAGFDSVGSNWPAAILAVVSILFAAVLALLTHSQARRADAVARLHAKTHQNLVERELMLSEMKHRIKNSITRVLAIARQTAKGSETLDDFMSSYAARLNAMANAQEMLTRSKWQRADLRELLRGELVQVFGERSDFYELSGPSVGLSERTTQALGLTFHELATNALKYGDLASDDGSLAVSWTVEDGQSGLRHLAFDWQESGRLDLTEPQNTGFGTRLIDMNVVRELEGTIERDFRADGLRIRMRIPLRDEDAEPQAATEPGKAG